MDTLKKIRRSISSTNTVQTTVPSGTIERKQTWIHSPDILLNGSVTYTLRLVGTKDVNKPKGTDVVREAIHAINFNNATKRAETSHEGAKPRKVDLRINVDGVTILDSKDKVLLYRYPLKRISFCSDDKEDKRYLAFIANEGDTSKSTCLVFLSDKMSEEITRTIGEAFDLCYKKFMDKNKLNLQNQKEVLLLRKKIAELEEENERLSEENQSLSRLVADFQRTRPSIETTNNSSSLLDTPCIPPTPMPIGPPPSLLPPVDTTQPSTSSKLISPTGFLPPPSAIATGAQSNRSIGPPPPVPTRRQLPTQITPPSIDSIFDDSFDPRASVNVNGSSNHKTKEEYDLMINDVDAQLANLAVGSSANDFSFEVADGGDAFKDVAEENPYGCPKNIVDPKNVQEIKNARPSFS